MILSEHWLIDHWYHFLLHLHLKLNRHVFSGRRRLEVRCHGARQVILIQSYIAKVNTYPFSGLDISQIYHRNCRQDSPVDFQLCLRRRHLRDHPGCSKVTLMPFFILFFQCSSLFSSSITLRSYHLYFQPVRHAEADRHNRLKDQQEKTAASPSSTWSCGTNVLLLREKNRFKTITD